MLCDGITSNNIKYDIETTGPQGGRFHLYGVKDYHDDLSMSKAKAELNREQDVVKFYVNYIKLEEWKKLNLFLHVLAKENKKLNEEYHKTLKL